MYKQPSIKAKKFNLKKGDAIVFVNPIGPSKVYRNSGIFIFNGKYGPASPDHGHFWYEIDSEYARVTRYPAYHAEIMPLNKLTRLEQVIYGA